MVQFRERTLMRALIRSPRKSKKEAAARDDADFSQIARDMRRASEEAKRAALLDPINSEMLTRKACDLENAALLIEQDANNRSNFVAFNNERWSKRFG